MKSIHFRVERLWANERPVRFGVPKCLEEVGMICRGRLSRHTTPAISHDIILATLELPDFANLLA